MRPRPRRAFRSQIWRVPRGRVVARRRVRHLTGVPEAAGVKSFQARVPISHHTRMGFVPPVQPPPTKFIEAKAASSSSAKCSLTTSSAAPGDTIAGTAAWRMLGWGGPQWWFNSASQYATAKNNGWGGASVGIQHMGPPTGLGGLFMFKGTSAIGDGGEEGGGNPWYYQQLLEHRFGQDPMAFANAQGMLMGIGFYTKSAGQNLDLPPLGGDWTNTTNRTNIANYLAGVAGCMNLVGMQELHFDIEHNGTGWNSSALGGATRTDVFNFGKTLAQAAHTVKPNMDVAVYSWYSTDGFDGEVFNFSSGGAAPTNYAQALVWEDFFCGWMEGMRLANATGYLYNLDAKFYRVPAAYIPGATFASAYKLDIERAMAWLSQISKPGNANSRPWASEALASYVLKVYRAAAFTWRGHDGTPFYVNTQPDDTTWTTMLSEARTRAMGPKRWEYTWAGSWTDESWYLNSGVISGGQANDDPTPISTSAPTISNLARVNNGGGSFTITCQASHLYGVTRVDLLLGSQLLQSMKMTFNANGGSITTNYNASFQDCTATLTGRSVSDTIIVKAYSAKDDIKVSSIVL